MYAYMRLRENFTGNQDVSTSETTSKTYYRNHAIHLLPHFSHKLTQKNSSCIKLT